MAAETITGVVLVHFALVAYGVGIVSEQRSQKITLRVLRFLQAGVAFDVLATTMMILGSGEGITPHGILGFSALAVMAAQMALAWRHRSAHGEADVPSWLHNYSRVAYGWWLVTYVAGAAMVAMGG